MKTLRIPSLAAAFAMLAATAAAQTPAAPDGPRLMTGMEPGGAMQPVMDQGIFTHAILNQLEGRFNGTNTQFHWDDGSAPITISCGSSRRALFKATECSMTAGTSFFTTAPSRRISVSKAGCAPTSIPARPEIGPP